MKQQDLEHLLVHTSKAGMLAYMACDPLNFERTLHLLLHGNKSCSWRAAWLLNSCMAANDQRVKRHLPALIEMLKCGPDNLQREIIKILLQMELDEDQEGLMFDQCIKIWKSIGKQPSVRFYAIKMLANISSRYEGLSGELLFLTQKHFTDPLSPGVKASVKKMMGAMFKTAEGNAMNAKLRHD